MITARRGAYFVTVCTHGRAHLFGDVVNGQMVLNDAGVIVAEEWMKSAQIRRELLLDEWIIMPNHFHAVVFIIPTGNDAHDDNGRGDRPVAPTPVVPRPAMNMVYERPRDGRGDRPVAPTPVTPTGPHRKSIASLMAGFKCSVTIRINISRDAAGEPVWQRNYYEYIIRSERSLNHIRQYISENPGRWAVDRDNPDAVTPEMKDIWRI